MNFSVTQILVEINFGHFEAQKSANLTILAGLYYEVIGNFEIFKCERIKNQIQSLQNC